MIYNENCIDGMKKLPSDSVDLIVTDPPYGMSFMGKQWDKALPPLESFKEMYRVLKPGSQAYIMCAPRSDLQSRMIILLEDAGFDVSNNPIFWTFATGFPKAQNISKQIDKRNGRNSYKEIKEYLNKQRKLKGYSFKQINEMLGVVTNGGGMASNYMGNKQLGNVIPTKEMYQKLKEILELDNRFDELIEREEAKREVIGRPKHFCEGRKESWLKSKPAQWVTKDATPEAQKYNGAYAGYQPKPAVEVILVATKPRREIDLDLHNKDCIDGMKELEENSIDLIVTDPPYGMSFMGKNWDKALPDPEAFKEMLRVLKPGAFAFVMCAPRSDLQARMSILLEDAGFDIAFTPIYWTFATGFPKAQNISKQIDKRNGRHFDPELKDYLNKQRKLKGYSLAKLNELMGVATNGGGLASAYMGNKEFNEIPTKESYDKLKVILELDNRFDKFFEIEEAEREVIGQRKNTMQTLNGAAGGSHKYGFKGETIDITKPARPEAIKYNGAYGGYQPKPAVEVVIVAMKPLSEKTYVDQVLNNGKGITWLDDCRIPYKSDKDFKATNRPNDLNNKPGNCFDNKAKVGSRIATPEGRFPANLLVSDDSLNDGIERKFDMHMPKRRNKGHFNQDLDSTKELKEIRIKETGSYSRYFDLDAWFAIFPKPAKSEKIKGVESNTHPTVKPIKLMSYLITLGSRPDEIVLDPFMGSGTTGISAKLTGRNFIGFELEEEYFQIAEARINAWEEGATGQDKEGRPEDKKNGKKKPDGPRTGQTSITSY